MVYLEWMGYACWPTNKKFTYINIEYWKASISPTCPYITLLDVPVLFVVPGSDEFPPISPLQLLLLCPNLPQPLHYLEMPALLLVGSLGSLTLFFLGLIGGWTRVTPLGLHIFCLLIGAMIGSKQVLYVETWQHGWTYYSNILYVEKYARDCMSTRYATYIPLPTTAICYGQVNSETLQIIFYFKLGLPCPTS